MSPLEKRQSSQGPNTPEKSPLRRTRTMPISIAQKQALIDNLQLEITERARRLRAQYNIQAQQLRSRVEMRINRIPTTLRKAKMGELLSKSSSAEPGQQPPNPPRSQCVEKPPPVPAKDGATPQPPISRKPVPISKTARGQKRMSEEITNDKENQGAVENPKKRIRGAPAVEPPSVQSGHVLSPTSSNARIIPARERPPSPTKTAATASSTISRPASPVKGSSTASARPNLFSSMVDKAKGTRGAAANANANTTTTKKFAGASSTSSSAGSTSTTTMGAAAGGGASRTRKAATTTTTAASKPAAAKPAATTRGRRKASETGSEASSGTTVVKRKMAASTASSASAGGSSRAKTTAAAPAPAPATTKKTVMGSIKSATTRKAPAAKTSAASAGTTGRTLRKRG